MDITLKGDCLDRGEYALTLFKIIADYAPKQPYDVIDEVDIGEIVEEDSIDSDLIRHSRNDEQIDEFLDDPIRFLEASSDSNLQQPQEQERELEYTIKLNHLDNEAFIMAISGSWGSGKTKFMEMFFNLLHGEDYQANGNETAVKFITDNKYKKDEVAYFDAWENDFYDDPIVPFAKMVLDTICVDQEKYKKAADTVWDTYQRMLQAKNDGLSIIKDREKLSDKIDEVKKLLRDSIKQMSQEKIIIIVDELDRCKPTFAIKLLEIVKHLFNVKGIVFIFALDIKQLQHCVKTVYGNAFDAIGYLERFFDYYSLLPKGSDEKLFHKFAEEYEILDNETDYYKMCQDFNLTPREMKGICSSFYYLNKYQLKDYPIKARLLYFYLLLLKHCHPEKVHSLLGENMQEARKEFFGQYMPSCLKTTSVDKQPFFTAVVENKTIKDTTFLYMYDFEKGEERVPRRYDFNSPLKEAEKGSLSYIIYPQDYKKDIGHMHVLEYLFTKIEAYGNAIPMEVKKEEIKRGKVMTFGRWHLHSEDDMEPIEWIVLDKDENTNMVLLITRYVIDAEPYHEKFVEITWEECSLRAWLNGQFLTEAFTETERSMIVPSHTDPGNDTLDDVFLLSINEASRYFGKDESRIGKPTEYAETKLEKRARGYGEEYPDAQESVDRYIERLQSSVQWWLRSPGYRSNFAAYVLDDGGVLALGDFVNIDRVGVRPALRINL